MKTEEMLLTKTAERVNILITTLNISQINFAKKINISQSTVNNIITGRNSPGTHFIRALEAAYPNINTEWILRGKGEMFIDPNLPPDAGALAPPVQMRVTYPSNEGMELIKAEIAKKDATIAWLQNHIEQLLSLNLGKLNPIEMSELLSQIGEQFGGRMAA